MKVVLPRRLLKPVFFFLASGFLAAPLLAMPPAAPPPHTTMVIFADHPLPNGEWPALFKAVRSTLVTAIPETRVLDPSPELIRGDHFVSGTLVQSPIVVFLHGDCALRPELLPQHYGFALGWVREYQGVIMPFVDVDCTKIGRVLGLRAGLMKKAQRVPAMADAMARVIVHEWIHIATQNPGHPPTGVAKASFSSNDLLKGRPFTSHSTPGITNALNSAPPANSQTAMAEIDPPE